MKPNSALPEAPVKWVEVDSFRFAYRESPNPGLPTLVLLHGLAEHSAFFWRPLIAALHDHYDIVAFDLLGHGDSSAQPSYGYRPAIQARLLHEALMQVRESTVPYTLLGHSMGGVLAARLALDFPQHVQRLILYDSPLPQGMLRNIFYNLRHVPFTALLPVAPLSLPGSGYVAQYMPFFSAILRFLLVQWRVPYRRERLDAEFLDQMNRASRIGLANSFRQIILKANILAEISTLAMPTLMIVGGGDVLVRVDLLTQVMRTNANLQLEVIPDAGHVSLLDQPERFMQALTTFLAQSR